MNYLIIISTIFSFYVASILCELTKEDAVKFLENANKNLADLTKSLINAQWDYAESKTNESYNISEKIKSNIAEYSLLVANDIKLKKWMTLKDDNLKRQFRKLSIVGDAVLEPKKLERKKQLLKQMDDIYQTASLFEYVEGETGMKKAWIEGRAVLSDVLKNLYAEYVELSNEAAKLNGFDDTSDMWYDKYDEKDFVEKLAPVLQEIKPLFEQLHAYIRKRLRNEHGNVVSEDGPIPHHLVGDIWKDVIDIALPYPNERASKITEGLVKNGWTKNKTLHMAEDFLISIGFPPMDNIFWEMSLNHGNKTCPPSAWDFYDGSKYAIRDCYRQHQFHYNVIYNLFAEVEYFREYFRQPQIFRSAANPAFYAAVGDLMNLFAQSPAYLKDAGLLSPNFNHREYFINRLFINALDVVTHIPISYVVDSWRTNVFKKRISSSSYTCEWWRLYEDVVGVSPPVNRTEQVFDAAALYEVIGDSEYIQHFVSNIIRFQIYKSLCSKAKVYTPDIPGTRPLYECHIYGSVLVGNDLRNMMKLGSSKPWRDALEVVGLYWLILAYTRK